MSHTPGPWVVREPEDDELHEIYAENGGDLICLPVWTHNQKANIPLIAAAPEMLAVCQSIAHDLSLLQFTDGVCPLDERAAAVVLRSLRAVIEQAEGVTTEGTNGKERSLD
jgi:hypothetical protein